MQPWRETAESTTNTRQRKQRCGGHGHGGAVDGIDMATQDRCDANAQGMEATSGIAEGTCVEARRRVSSRRRGIATENSDGSASRLFLPCQLIRLVRDGAYLDGAGPPPAGNFAKKPSLGCVVSHGSSKSSQSYATSALNVPKWPQ
jgi:hypothetical protein